jgi:hypothetical protein
MFFQERPIERMEDLYDKREELARLKRAMGERAITLVLGLRRMGKTSLIRVATADILKIYVDARKFEERNYITYRDFMEELRSALNALAPRHKRALELLKAVAGVRIVGVEVTFSWKDGQPSFASVLEALDRWAEGEGKRLVIVVDEVQELIKLKGFNVIPVIAYAYDNLRNLSFVLAGSKVGLLFNFLRVEDPSSPLHGRYMERVELERLSRELSLDFLTKGFRQAGVDCGPKVLQVAVDRLDGIIGWLSYFGLMALRRGADEEVVDAVLEEASRMMIKEFSAFVDSRRSGRYAWVMKAAKSGATWSEIKTYLELKTGETIYDSELAKLLKNLADAGFLAKDGSRYVIPDPVLGFAVDRL